MPTIFLNKNQYASNGGKEMVLTQTQYDNLSEQDKMNGMTYYICDADSDKNGDFQPVIYNTNEREIGVWCDGKPLYQKTIVLTGTYYGSTDIGNINISSPDTIIIISCAGLYYDNSWRAFNFSHPDNNNTASIFIKSDGVIVIRCGSSVTSQYPYNKIILNLQYTKTTDTPGSGSWTPGGVPAHHYSTDEQIVGTWIDGKTIYQKTFQFTNLSSSTNNWVDLIFFPGVDNMLSMTGHTIFLNDGQRQQIPVNSLYVQTTYLNNYLKYYCQSVSGNLDMFLTIQYTKTTS